MHRPANVDAPETAAALVRHLHGVADLADVVIPVHPRGRAAVALHVHGLAAGEVLLGVVIVIRFLRVRTRSLPIIFLVNGIRFILVDFLVFFGVLVVCLFFCTGFRFVCAFLFGLD